MTHPRYPVAVHVFLVRGGQVLFLRRANTGYEDGRLSVVAGHVEPGESVTAAALRELREEVGLTFAAERLRVVGVMHRLSEEERVDFFLVGALEARDREPVNSEPAKCAELVWAPADDPPPDTIPYVAAALRNFADGRWYAEHGWPSG